MTPPGMGVAEPKRRLRTFFGAAALGCVAAVLLLAAGAGIRPSKTVLAGNPPIPAQAPASGGAKGGPMANVHVKSGHMVGPPINIAPTGYIISEGRSVHGMIDIAAPLDADTGAAVPAIVVPSRLPPDGSPHQGAALGPVPTSPGQAQVANLPPEMSAPEGAQQLSEASDFSARLGDDEDMYPKVHTEAEQYLLNGPLPDLQAGPTMAAPPPVQLAPPPPVAMMPPAGVPAGSLAPLAPHVALPPQVAAPAAAAAPSAPIMMDEQHAYVPAARVPRAVPNYFKAPFDKWSEEDHAVHAYNLAQWRVKILQAKLHQAQLRKRLQDLSSPPVAAATASMTKMVHVEAPAHGGQDGDDFGAPREGRREQPRGRGVRGEDWEEGRRERRDEWRGRGHWDDRLERLRDATGAELRKIEAQVHALAKITARQVKAQRAAPPPTPPAGGGSTAAVRALRAHTDQELRLVIKALHAVQRKVDRGPDPAQALAAVSRASPAGGAGGAARVSSDDDDDETAVERQMALWKKVTSDVGSV